MENAVSELRKACQCLYLAVDESIADYIKGKAESVIKLVAPTPPTEPEKACEECQKLRDKIKKMISDDYHRGDHG